MLNQDHYLLIKTNAVAADSSLTLHIYVLTYTKFAGLDLIVFVANKKKWLAKIRNL